MESQHEFIEGIKVRAKTAPILKRFIAAGIDIGIVTAVAYIVFILFLVFGGMAAVVMASALKNIRDNPAAIFVMLGVFFIVMLGLMSLTHIYFIYFESKYGATPGKKMMGLRVVSTDNSPLTRGQAVYRDLVRWYIDALFILPGLLSILMTKNRQRIGDLLANTMVVHSDVSEARQNFAYVKREDYIAIFEHLDPKPLSADVREEYLTFASQAYLMGKKNPALESQWLTFARGHFERSEEIGLNDFTVLRFFAEYCFQEDLKTRSRKD